MGSEKRNVILVTFDSLRADHCGFIDPESTLTPNLDAVAERGTVFERAIAPAPRTPTSVPEMMTGTPMVHAAADSRGAEMSRIRDHVSRFETVAERFAARGYTTAGFSANPWTGDETGLPGTFDHYDRLDDRGHTLLYRLAMPVVTGTTAGAVVYYLDSFLRKTGSFSQWPVFAEDLFETIDALPEPFFVWVFLMDTHNPYLVPPADRVENSTFDMYYGMLRGNSQLRHPSNDTFLGDDIPPGIERRIVRAYRDSVRSVDRFAGRLDDRIDTAGTTLVFSSDHGEGFDEHGTYGHQNALYAENVHVPLLVADGGHESQVVEDAVSLRSLPELLLSLGAGEGVPATELTEGPVVSRTASGDTLAVRTRRWKYIGTPNGAELYDLEGDPGETHSVADDHPETCEEMERALEEHRQTVPETGEGSEGLALGDEVESHLRTLGYVD